MATLTMPSGVTARATRPHLKCAAGNISSLRVRPFTRATRTIAGAPRHQVLLRAADREAEEFSFSFSDAKKGNEYVASDVEAAIRFYAGEGAAPGDTNSEFVENLFGVEDASFFDDIDNNEAYEDEFNAAGIPEAAPKQRQVDRDGDQEGDAGDSDDISAAKRADREREIEEQMVLEAELQETGLDEEFVEEDSYKPVGPDVWDWMTDLQAEDDDEEVSAIAKSTKAISASVMAALPSDEQLFADMRSASLQDLDQETRDIIEFILDDFDIEHEVKVIPDDLQEILKVPEFTQFGDSDLQRIDALLSEVVSMPEMEDIPQVEAIVDDGLEMSEEAVENYVATLKNAQGAELSDDQLKEIFGDEPIRKVEVDDAEITMDDVDLTEPEVEPLAESEFVVEAIEDDLDEIDDVESFQAELLALRAMPEANIEIPPMENLDLLGEYVSATEQFLEAEQARKAQLAEQVIKGELPADVLDYDDYTDEYNADVETELLMPDDLDDMEDAVDDLDEENWQERILELTRVTKVVKGGKLMGFRCTAVVGNGNGLVGVGCQSGREIATAVKRALVDAKKAVVRVPLVGAGTIPHRVEAKFNAARCVILPAADGTGVLAGSSIRSVLELAGVQNVLAKRLGCRSLLNNARCAVAALEQLRTLQEVSKSRGVPMSRLLLPSRR